MTDWLETYTESESSTSVSIRCELLLATRICIQTKASDSALKKCEHKAYAQCGPHARTCYDTSGGEGKVGVSAKEGQGRVRLGKGRGRRQMIAGGWDRFVERRGLGRKSGK